MAAFRRGVDLAEAQTADEPDTADAYSAPEAVNAYGAPDAGPVVTAPGSTPTIGAQRAHGLAPLPFRSPATGTTAGAERAEPEHREPQQPEPDQRTENMFKE